jgi:hypothetical protein
MQADIHENINGWGKAPNIVKAIDMGSPTGILWANANLGFKKSTSDIGDRYSWGDFGNSGCHYLSNENPDSPYANIMTSRFQDEEFEKNCLKLSHDVANKEWGGKWRIPSFWQFKELLDYCDIEYIHQPTCSYLRFISQKTGNILFLPFCRYERDNEGNRGKLIDWTQGYWSRCYSCKDLAWLFTDHRDLGQELCKAGLPIRPVWMPDLKL